MFEDISVINAVYQFIVFAVWLGVIFFVVSFVRNNRENRRRLKRLEEQVDYLIKKVDKQ